MFKAAIGLDQEKQTGIRFGNLKYVSIYEVSDGAIKYTEEREIPDVAAFRNSDEFSCHGKNDGFLNALGQELEGIKYLIVAEAGNYPSRILLRYGIYLLEQQGETYSLLEKIRSYEKRKNA